MSGAKHDKHLPNKYCFQNKLKATENGFNHPDRIWLFTEAHSLTHTHTLSVSVVWVIQQLLKSVFHAKIRQ